MENYMNAIVFAYYEAGLYEENGLKSKNNKEVVGIIVEKIDSSDDLKECVEEDFKDEKNPK